MSRIGNCNVKSMSCLISGKEENHSKIADPVLNQAIILVAPQFG